MKPTNYGGWKVKRLIWYMKEGRIHSAPILSKMTVENAYGNEYVHTDVQKEFFQRFGEGGIYYATCHGIVAHENAYPNEDCLMRALIKFLNEPGEIKCSSVLNSA